MRISPRRVRDERAWAAEPRGRRCRPPGRRQGRGQRSAGRPKQAVQGVSHRWPDGLRRGAHPDRMDCVADRLDRTSFRDRGRVWWCRVWWCRVWWCRVWWYRVWWCRGIATGRAGRNGRSAVRRGAALDHCARPVRAGDLAGRRGDLGVIATGRSGSSASASGSVRRDGQWPTPRSGWRR